MGLESAIGRGRKQQDLEPFVKERTRCCADAHQIILGVFLVENPSFMNPTSGAPQIGGFRACSRCHNPLGTFASKPGYDLPRDVWVKMVERVKTHGPSAYWAQKNDDGSIGLYDWYNNPQVRRMRGKSITTIEGQTIPSKGSFIAKKNKALEQGQLLSEHEQRKANGYQTDPVEIPEATVDDDSGLENYEPGADF